MAEQSIAMADKAELKSFATPDEVREFPRGRLELIKVGGATIGRAVFEPDAWVVGDEAAVVVDFQGMLDYAAGHRHA